jgi:hypothetical protein
VVIWHACSAGAQCSPRGGDPSGAGFQQGLRGGDPSGAGIWQGLRGGGPGRMGMWLSHKELVPRPEGQRSHQGMDLA